MSALFIVDSASNRLNITNPKIIAFYQSNQHIDFESVNLLLIEILQKSGSIKPLENVIYQDDHKTKELESFLSNMREGIRRLIQSISSKYIIAKSEYIREFKSASLEREPREWIVKTNQKFFENACSLLSDIFQLRISNIAEKTKVMLHQFNKILTANTDQMFSKTDFSIKVDEYIQNFESNSTHMIQAITQLLSDCLSSYELKVHDSIKNREDQSSTVYYKLIYELNDIVHQLPNTDDNPEHAVSFEHLLSQTFPTASISTDPESNEYNLIRDDKSSIYIELHEKRDYNIGISDVKQFVKRAIDKGTNSILVSQYTGITSKPNYHIEIHNNIVVIYIHKLANCSETLQKATDMIDAISGKLTEFCSLSENKYSIPKDILDGINREYQQFILQKETIVTGFKEQQKRLLMQLDDMRFSTLDKYLSTRYSSCKKQGYNCDMCNNFNVGTLKGLAAHKRGCARKLQKTTNESFDDFEIPIKKSICVL
jgi:hypothetical protein